MTRPLRLFRIAAALPYGLVAALFFVLAVVLAGSARAEPSFRFTPYTPLRAQELVESRLRFRGGVPMVSVGLADGADALTVEAAAPVRLVFDEDGTPRKVYAAAGSRLGFRPREVKPAERRWWVRVEQLADGAEAAARRWRARDLRVRVARVGALFAVQGTVLDTRAEEVLVGGFATRGEAEALAEELFRREGLRAPVRPTLEARARGRIEILGPDGAVRHTAEDAVYVGAAEGTELVLREGCLPASESCPKGRRYPGHLYVTVGADGGLAAVLSIDAESLLRGVVPAEIFATSPAAALEAQAIVARGAILAMLGHRHYDAPYHVCDRQHCQVYGGLGATHPGPDAAVASTRGQLAVRPRARAGAPLALVDSVYSSSCGGHGAANETVWDQPPSPSLRARLDGPPGDPVLAPFRAGITEANLKAWVEGYPPTYCARASFARPEKFRWAVGHDAEALRDRWARLRLGEPVDVEVLGRGRGGRVRGLRLVGTEGRADVLRELPVRRLFGLRSGAFHLEKAAAGGRLEALRFTGAGWGHGVGMCQMGAIGRAEAGQSAADILEHYYSGAVVEKLY